MRIKITVALVALLSAIPIAMAKGKPAGVAFSVLCNSQPTPTDPDGDTDFCTIHATGLSGGGLYIITIDSNQCGGITHTTNQNADPGGTINVILVPPEVGHCSTSSWTFSLYSLSDKGKTTLVASTTAGETE